MSAIIARIQVASDGSISSIPSLPAGEYEVHQLAETPQPKRSVLDIPSLDGPWDDSTSLRREDLYDYRVS